MRNRMALLCLCLIHVGLAPDVAAQGIKKDPVYIGFDGSFQQKTNTAALSIQQGAQIAIDEINAHGGVLNGRPLELVVTDNQTVSMRGRDNYVALAGKKDLVAVLGGQHSPVIIEAIPDIQRLKVPYISVWGSASQITDTISSDSYLFRVSLKDSWGVVEMLRRAKQLGGKDRVCVLLPNTSWGRSGDKVIHDEAPHLGIHVSLVRWFNWGDNDFSSFIQACKKSDAGSILMVANEIEGARVVNDMAALPPQEQLPIVAHWGITGGAFNTLTGNALSQVRLQIIQTFAFGANKRPQAIALGKKAATLQRVASPEQISSPVGIAQAYDAVYLLAAAIQSAKSTNGEQIRNALESLPVYEGAIKRYNPAFTRNRHDALDRNQVLFVTMKPDGRYIPAQ